MSTDVSESPSADDLLIADLARARGYQLAHVLTITAQTYMPVTLIMQIAAAKGATAVIAPDIGHFGGRVSARAVALALDLETRSGTVSSNGSWDAAY